MYVFLLKSKFDDPLYWKGLRSIFHMSTERDFNVGVHKYRKLNFPSVFSSIITTVHENDRPKTISEIELYNRCKSKDH